MEGEKHGKGIFQGCDSINQKIFARASSSESLEEGPFAKKRAWSAAPSGSILKKRFSRLDPVAFVNKLKGTDNHDKAKPGLGTLSGVLIPTCENMWGVLIFLRFYYIVGNAGIWQSFLMVFLSFLCAILTTISLSAIATNGPIEEGGTYFLISRALGPKLGGSVGIMYYLGVSLLAVLESLGAVEMLLFTFPGLQFSSATRVVGAIILLILCALVYFGISFVSKLSMLFFLIVLYTMGSYYLGLFTAPRGHAPANLTGLKWNTFKDNWNSGYDHGVSFPVALALFFPCFTGILSGADRAKNLACPERSIPAGTIGAVTISLVMYLSYMGLWSAVGTRDYLLGRAADGTQRENGGDSGNLEVVIDVAFPLAILTQLGIIIASMAQALQCLITSPRLLQAIASDGVIPILSRLSRVSKNGEPRAALLVTTVICVLAAMIGSLDAVAPFVSICFLTAYSALNFSCFVLSILKAPSWRPKWKFYHWSAALVGFLLCFAVNFVIKYYLAIVAVVVQVIIYVYIDYRQVEVDWGTGLGGLRLQLAVQSILSVGHEARYSVNWRPQLLCLCKPRSARAPDDHNNEEFMLFVSQLKKGRGLCVVASVIEGSLENMAPQLVAERLELENSMQTANVTGFARVLVAPTYKEGKTYAIQSSGLGALEPNTLVLGWPNKWYEEGHYHSAQVMLEILDECKAVDKAVVLCMNLDEFPTAGNQQEGYIDVWWIIHDGGLLLILAHLLKQHKIWRKCKLRVHTVSEQIHDPVLVKRNLKRLLDRIRIEAEVLVIDMDTGGLAPYTYDTTIRLEEARAFAEEVVQYRLAQEQQKKPESSKQAAVKPQRNQRYEVPSEVLEQPVTTPSLHRSKSGNRQTLDNIFKDMPPGHTQPNPFQDALDVPGVHLDDGTRQSALENQKNNANSGRFEWINRPYEPLEKAEVGNQESLKAGRNVDQTPPALAKSQSGHTADNILKRTVPTELSMLEGVPHQPRPRSGPLHAFKTHIAKLSLDPTSEEMDLPSPTKSRKAKDSETSHGGVSPGQDGRVEKISGDPSTTRMSPSHTTASMRGIEEDSSSEEGRGRGLNSGQTWTGEVSGETVPARLSSTPTTSSRRRIEDGSPSPMRSNSIAEPLIPDASEDPNVRRGESDSGAVEYNSAKETRWADDYGHNLEEENIAEIVVEGSTENELNDADHEEDGVIHEMVRTGSAGQLYPGSPHDLDLGGVSGSQDFPEAFNRTWETFSQNYSPNKLNEIIMEQSKDAQLVVLNLPDHYKGMEPGRYMEYCEDVTRGLRRVLLVHGTGKELWNPAQL